MCVDLAVIMLMRKAEINYLKVAQNVREPRCIVLQHALNCYVMHFLLHK